MKRLPAGFTLIEVLIALMVFAIIGGITASAMYYAFNTRSRINAYSDRLAQLQLAVHLLDQATNQIINRPVRGNDMRSFPAFVGTVDYMEFTRAGLANPNYSAQRSTLKRIALLCNGDQLIQRSWLQLDTPDRTRFEDRMILDNLKHCQFRFMNKNQQYFKEWLAESRSPDQQKQPFPLIIEIDLELNDWGKLNLLFPVSGALYADIY